MAITVNIYYSGDGDNARKFAAEMISSGTVARIKAEEGNLKYDYSFDAEDSNALILTELWKDHEAVAFHNGREHFKKLGEMKSEYVESVEIQRFEAEQII